MVSEIIGKLLFELMKQTQDDACCLWDNLLILLIFEENQTNINQNLLDVKTGVLKNDSRE
jgi:hypothetical protein